ncbi:UDP-N-acetylmuramoyl-tripeptide--D-alanyl-D-alanine ligase [Anoxybacillus rupiensis]|jgi:UDP-N-acetylmuramoyl-tripeptide--D-alanyl-D-alanine ligase|uniref:UDP-N-acetylmuramoyl-tripeptide--D-alanyl-D-alanine ligase n=1 Tax=Anoxybacteroides rupiense TaxID=311460 RepID=A0ABD5IXJ7_9BACL|nr:MULTISPECIES: UDP-N-acetylmuramoyl-tripeptide--D-alanyl-D-alanine ligase [Anoxybacillus]KXG09536.1 UDP-N-acetylmuramoyl-tripeptide--D-alanyl-D-alanine ligase [Anoxybacillus sp. P3H1B]MBB3908898.1 UDP-N-acetylmuramoyl-tripeptide--D-alanyl-D-alanine ligase [Anoxybacillus rupiensis]MBS2771872.1 UDP-N-acetylmuramoyl-tripeptide--D-alanyl-D-alanine ligase [Anoxybacillus rupiensis]MDE8565516.1 UDP-N-acetylmuramoyl-tripeptide--D-alanyl-D-alanine ligase [Anoxybacillus rupiensis]MED5052524.1 UDP-N-ac
MIVRTLRAVEEMVDGNGLAESFYDTAIKGVSTDTRTIQPGNLYIPLKGANFNGHAFVADAFAKGASAALWEKNEANPPTNVPLIFVDDTLQALQQLANRYRKQLAVKVVGITGSNGKTTTKDMVYGLLASTYKVQKTEGNLNNHIGVPLTLLRLKEDTEIAVVEMGMSNFGEIELLSKISEPSVAIITNIGESHLQELGSRDGIARAKLEIVSGLQSDGVFVYYGDEPLLQTRVKNIKRPLRMVTFGQKIANDYYPTDISLEVNGTSFTVNQAPDYRLFLPILGRHHVYNALAAISVARLFHVSWEAIQASLAELQMTKMRMEIIKAVNGATMINDAYNASPTSMKAALELLFELTGYEKKIAVLGDMLELGDQEIEFHQQIGRMLQSEKLDYVLTYGKRAGHIALAAQHSFPSGRVQAYDDKQALARDLRSIVSARDLILFKASRGMRLEDIIRDLQA